MPILGTIASSISGNLDSSAVFPVAIYTAPSNVANITFSGIPQTYTHLQLRLSLRNTAANNYATISINSGSYRQHYILATGTAPFGVNSVTTTDMIASSRSDSKTLYFSYGLIDIEDYSSTTRYKAIRAISGSMLNESTSGGVLYLASMLSVNTSAVTTITITPSSGSFATYSRATIYGWK